MPKKQPAVYIMASSRNGTLYVGVTGSLIHRVHQHREGSIAGFSKEYRTRLLVHYEFHADFPAAILRETQIKGWKRKWKTNLIELANPYWHDLWPDLVGCGLEKDAGFRPSPE